MNNSGNQNINKKVFLQAKYFFLARLLQVIIVFGILILFSLRLSKENYGLYQGSWVFINLFAPLLFLGLPQQLLTLPGNGAISHFFWLLKKYFPYYVTAVLIFITTLFFLHQKFSIALLICIFICTLFQSVMLLMDNLVIKLNADLLFLKQNFLYSLLFLALHYAWLYAETDMEWLVVGIAFIGFLKSAAYFLFIRKLNLGVHLEVADTLYFEKQWKLLSLNEILNRFTTHADKLAIIFLLSISGFSVYYNGTYELPFFAMLVSALGNSLSVQLSNNNTGAKSAAALFKQSIVTGSSVAFPLFFFFYIFSTPVFQFFFNGKYMDSVPLFNIAIFIAFLRVTNFAVILQVFKKNHTILFGSIIDLLVNIGSVVILYPFLGINAFPAGFVIGTAFQIAYYIYKTKKLINAGIRDLIPLTWLLALIVALTLFYSLLFFILQPLQTWAIIGIAAIITTAIIYLLTHYFGSKINYKKQLLL